MGKAGIAEEERRVQRLSSSHPLSLISSLRAWGQVGSENYDCHTSSFVLDRHTIGLEIRFFFLLVRSFLSLSLSFFF